MNDNDRYFSAGTPYEGGKFRVQLILPKEFPSVPPRGYFLTKVFHPNVATPSGEICVNTLKKDWTSDLGLRHVFLVSVLFYDLAQYIIAHLISWCIRTRERRPFSERSISNSVFYVSPLYCCYLLLRNTYYVCVRIRRYSNSRTLFLNPLVAMNNRGRCHNTP